MLQDALKEWAVLCKALADGWQTLLLRKGGIHEAGFRVSQPRFWLFPTYVHQQESGIVPAALPMLAEVKRDRPPGDAVRLSHFAEVHASCELTSLEQALALGGQHFLSEETVRQRFAYRRPGLTVMVLRVFRIPQVAEIPNNPVYDGCRSWVTLSTAVSTANSEPVLGPADWQRRVDAIVGAASLPVPCSQS